MQTFNSNYSKSTMKNRSTPHLPKLGATESVVEVSLLDVMDVEDFLHLVKTKTDSNWKELWKETCLVVNQLKAARELLSIGSSLIGNKPTRKILDRLVEVSHIMLNAERVVVMELDPSGNELVVTHSREERLIGLRIPSQSGIEGRTATTPTLRTLLLEFVTLIFMLFSLQAMSWRQESLQMSPTSIKTLAIYQHWMLEQATKLAQ